MRTALIRTKLKEMEESLQLVLAHLPATLEEFIALGLIKDGLYKRVEYCIENVFDICAIINADLELGIPGDDEDLVEHLARNEIVSEEMRAKLKGMRGFRNIVVHRYGAVDDRIAFAILTEHVRDFHAFATEIRELLEVAAD